MIRETNSVDKELDEVLERLKYDDAISFLRKELINNYELRERFITEYKSQFSADEIDEYISQVINGLKSCENYYYFSSEDVSNTIKNVVDGVAPNCIKNGNLNQALLIVESLFDYIISEESHFGSIYLPNLATRYKQIICIVDEKLRQDIQKTIIKFLSQACESRLLRAEQLITELEMILINDFTTDAELKQTKQYLQQICNKVNRQEFSESYFERQVMNLINTCESMNNLVDVEAIIDQYIDLFEVCKYRVKKLTENQEYDQAVAVITDTRETIKNQPNYKLFISLLCDVYEKLGLIEEIKRELIMMLSMDHVCDVKCFNRLKEYYPKEEWIQIRKSIISQFASEFAKEQYYYSEQMGDELYTIAIKFNDVEKVVKYHQLIKQVNPKVTLEKYKNHINMIADEAGRENYIRICDLLCLMQDYSEGDLVVTEIIEKLSSKYNRRVSLINLLNLVKSKTYKQEGHKHIK